MTSPQAAGVARCRHSGDPPKYAALSKRRNFFATTSRHRFQARQSPEANPLGAWEPLGAELERILRRLEEARRG
jgi:hypothetical protein